MFKPFFLIFVASASLAYSFPSLSDAPEEVVINNRILTKVNNTTISVMDVMRKMDLFLNRYYPQESTSNIARYQFYASRWRETLQQLIDQELVMADADNRGIKVSDGEVRQEMQERFGPNVMETLNQMNISYEEARKLTHQELIVQRMNWLRVTSKALQKVNSQDVKDAYKEFCQENPPQHQWKYQMISIRCDRKEVGKELAQKVFAQLKKLPNPNPSEALKNLKYFLNSDEISMLTLSQEYTVEDKQLAETHKSALNALLSDATLQSFSQPIEQISRDGSVVYRIFFLKDHAVKQPPAFDSIASEIKDGLLQKVASEEMIAYTKKLRQRFGYDERSLDLPDAFEPFSIR
jgi:hypothetical protein